jgi:excisionase family DNA binding protein
MAESFQPDFRPEPALYSKEQAAIFLGVSVRTIESLLHVKALVSRKIGARTLIPVTSLRAFLTKDHATGEAGKRRKNHETRNAP